MQTELLARLIEVVSVIAARYKLKKPIEVPRPDHLQAPTALERRDEAVAHEQGTAPLQASPTGMDKAFALMASTARSAGAAG